MSPFSPEAERQMAELEARRRARTAELLEGRFTARTIGNLAELGIGLEAWSREGLAGRLDYHGDPLGGIVVDHDAGGGADPATGEIRPARFEFYDPLVRDLGRAFRWLTEDQIDPATVAIPKDSSLALAVRAFAGEVCQCRRKRKLLTLTSWEADMMRHGWRLSAVLMGQR